MKDTMNVDRGQIGPSTYEVTGPNPHHLDWWDNKGSLLG